MNLTNVYKIYNFSSINYNKILEKNFSLKQTLHIQNKNVIINKFNLHHLI